MYTLIGSTTSPYVRKLRLYFKAHNLNYEFKAINYLEKHDADFLKSVNPINKIPILLIDNLPLYDSRVIFNHLNSSLGLAKLTIEEENILSAIDAAMDTSINLFSLRRGGLDLSTENAFLLREQERTILVLNYLKSWVTKLNVNKSTDWNFLSMSLYSYLYWGQFRNILDLSNQPEMLNFLENFKNKDGIKETEIPA